MHTPVTKDQAERGLRFTLERLEDLERNPIENEVIQKRTRHLYNFMRSAFEQYLTGWKVREMDLSIAVYLYESMSSQNGELSRENVITLNTAEKKFTFSVI